MGFPTWTLFGMAVALTGVLIMLLFAYIAQSPRLLKRLGLSGSRLDLRSRTFTGFALAFLVLAFGFFMAGVPLGDRSPAAEVAAATAILEENDSGTAATLAAATPEIAGNGEEAVEEVEQNADEGRPATGAVVGHPPAAQTATAEAEQLLESEETAAGEGSPASATPRPSATATPTPTASHTPTPSPTATATPLPTLTPTPIFEETAVVNTGTSTLWIKRTPGGRDFAIVKGGDTLILLPGHANVGGALWREVRTVDGTIGWVLESYLGQELADSSEVN